MNLYLLRHGPARDKEAWAPRPDRLRPLTNPGKEKVKDVAKGLRRRKLSFDVILTSPYKRAFQTAKIVAKTLGQKRKLVEFSPLVPGGSVKDLVRELARHGKKWHDVLLVGHEPSLSRWIALLTTGHPESSLELKKAGLAKLVVLRPVFGRCAMLEFLLPPKYIS
jgi:phosphohistidine phosphatase